MLFRSRLASLFRVARSAAAAGGVLLASCSAAPPDAGGGIVSLNPCADAMLLALVSPERISAISHYSADPTATSIPLEVARRFRTTAGTAEEVVALSPDLVIASAFTQPATRSAFAAAGLNVLYLDSPATIAASKAQVMQLAEAVDAPDRGAALNARIDTALSAAAPSPGEPLPALLFLGGNLVTGSGTLLHEMLEHAGFRNAAAEYGLRFTGTLPAERVIADPPRVLLSPEADGREGGARAARLREHILSIMGARVHQAHFPRHLVNCGGPVIVDAMARLAQVRREVE